MNNRFEISGTAIAGVCLLTRKPVGDHRGFLERLFCENDLAPVMAGRYIVQVNHTATAGRGTVRGMHFQHPPHAEAKIVSCLKGEVFDVAVDLRRHSPTFLHWHAEVLGKDNFKTLFIPEGVAHGFQVLSDDCDLLYCHTAAYHGPAEGGLNPLDPCLAIDWPLPVSGLSQRDAAHPLVDVNTFTGFDL
jgi:dTDP-4-dehydrorhamnose 3,5-epimerase